MRGRLSLLPGQVSSVSTEVVTTNDEKPAEAIVLAEARKGRTMSGIHFDFRGDTCYESRIPSKGTSSARIGERPKVTGKGLVCHLGETRPYAELLSRH